MLNHLRFLIWVFGSTMLVSGCDTVELSVINGYDSPVSLLLKRADETVVDDRLELCEQTGFWLLRGRPPIEEVIVFTDESEVARYNLEDLRMKWNSGRDDIWLYLRPGGALFVTDEEAIEIEKECNNRTSN